MGYHRNRSHQPSRIGNLKDYINETVDKSTLQEYSRLNKSAIEMTSKRWFYLKESKKLIKNQIKLERENLAELKNIKDELKFLETVNHHLRNRWPNLVDFEQFKLYINEDDLYNIFRVVEKLNEMNKQYILKDNQSKSPLSIGEMWVNQTSGRPSDKALKMILNEQIKPRLYSEVRFQALEDIKRKNRSKIKLQQTSPKEFNFNSMVRASTRKKTEQSLMSLNKSFDVGAEGKYQKDSISLIQKLDKSYQHLENDKFELYKPEHLPSIKSLINK